MSSHRTPSPSPHPVLRALLATSFLAAPALAAPLLQDPVDDLHDPAAEHADQHELATMVKNGLHAEAFELAFEHGDELFEVRFNVLDGVGARVGNGERFTRVPRADLSGPGEWASHFPERTTGPNAEACVACHDSPFDDGAGLAAGNVHRDPLHRGEFSAFIQRNTPHLFAPGAVQRLAEEMTAILHGIRAAAVDEARRTGTIVTSELLAKGVHFGTVTAKPSGAFDAQPVGVDRDLVVRPFQWKGSVGFLRDFNRGAAHNELGMQGTELVGAADGDGDGVREELTVGDVSALTLYLAAQPRPTSLLELSHLGLLETPLTAAQRDQIRRGRRALREIGCTGCHVPNLFLDEPIFQEPSALRSHRDTRFPAGQDPLALGLDPAYPVRFDLTADQPDNQIPGPGGEIVHLGSLPTDARGRGVVQLYGDLKRHDLGPELAEGIDEVGTGASVFLTENLWGVGSTAPYMHDGRATTLTEAILLHGGEARPARLAFLALPRARQEDVIAFLELFKVPEEEGLVATATLAVGDGLALESD